jgi:hypothetical protein
MERPVEDRMGTTNNSTSAAKHDSLDSHPAAGPQTAKSTTTSNGLFGTPPVPNPTASSQSPSGGGIFAGQLGTAAGNSSQKSSGGGLFGTPPAPNPTASSQSPSGGGIFAGQLGTAAGNSSQKSSGGGLFGTPPAPNPTASSQSPSEGGIFAGQLGTVAGNSSQKSTGGGLFGGRLSQDLPPTTFGTRAPSRFSSNATDSEISLFGGRK